MLISHDVRCINKRRSETLGGIGGPQEMKQNVERKAA